MQKERVDKALADYVESVEKADGKHVKLRKKYRSEKRRLIALSIYDSECDFRYGSIEQWCEHGWLDYRRLCATLSNAGFLTTDWGIDGAKPPSERKLTPAQVKFHAEWDQCGDLHVVSSVEQAINVALTGKSVDKDQQRISLVGA